MFLLGVSAVSLAMILIGLNLFSVGIALPFSLHISLSLLGLGVAAIVTSCAVNLAGIAPTQEPERRDVEPGSTSGNSVSQPKKIRPRGHRAFSRYFSRQIRHAPANTQKKTG